jgi:uncharacterized protein YcaQ
MCCTTGSHQGFQRWVHQNACFCGCDDPPYLRPRFMTKKQRIVKLENHLAGLRDEVEAVEAHIAQIKKEK